MKIKNKKQLLIQCIAIVVVIAIAVCMFIIGRGHTVYLDNKKLEYNGTTYEPMHKIKVFVDGEDIAKLSAKDRGMTDVMGQSFSMTLEVTRQKGDAPQTIKVTLPLPYSMDGIVINLPALLEGASQEAYMSEFVSLATEVEDATEEVPTGDSMEGFAMPTEEANAEETPAE